MFHQRLNQFMKSTYVRMQAKRFMSGFLAMATILCLLPAPSQAAYNAGSLNTDGSSATTDYPASIAFHSTGRLSSTNRVYLDHIGYAYLYSYLYQWDGGRSVEDTFCWENDTVLQEADHMAWQGWWESTDVVNFPQGPFFDMYYDRKHKSGDVFAKFPNASERDLQSTAIAAYTAFSTEYTNQIKWGDGSMTQQEAYDSAYANHIEGKTLGEYSYETLFTYGAQYAKNTDELLVQKAFTQVASWLAQQGNLTAEFYNVPRSPLRDWSHPAIGDAYMLEDIYDHLTSGAGAAQASMLQNALNTVLDAVGGGMVMDDEAVRSLLYGVIGGYLRRDPSNGITASPFDLMATAPEAMTSITSTYEYHVYGDGSGGYQDMCLPLTASVIEGEYDAWIKVKKVDQNGDPLQGAVFQLADYEGGTGERQTTGADGIATWYRTNTTDLFPQTYWVSEVTPPPGGYQLDSNNYSVTVNFAEDTPESDAVWVRGYGPDGAIENDIPDPSTSTSTAGLRKVNTAGEGVGPATFEFTGVKYTGEEVDRVSDESTQPEGGYERTEATVSVPAFNIPTEANGEYDFQWWDPGAEKYIAPGTYTVQEIVPPPGYDLGDGTTQTIDLYIQKSLDASGNVLVEYLATPTYLQFINAKKPTVVLKKIDGSTGDPLEGAVFDIYYNDDKIGSETTDSNGEIILDGDGLGLATGTYEFYETSAPPGYSLPSKVHHSVYVDSESGIEEYTLTAVNHKAPDITVYKRSQACHYLPCALFEIRVDATVIMTTKTNEDGHILIPGSLLTPFLDGKDSVTVYVEELEPPPGYLMADPDQRIQEIEVFAGTEGQAVTFQNEAPPEIEILKLDAYTGLGVPGAVFEVLVGNRPAFEVVSDEDGKILINYESHGEIFDVEALYWTIQVREVSPPAGYLHDDTDWKVVTAYKGQSLVSFVFENTPMPEIRILKTSTETGLPLEFAHFRVTIDGHDMGEYVSGEDGYVIINYEEYKEFLDITKEFWMVTVEETQAPPGYLIHDTNSHTLRLDRGLKYLDFAFSNARHPDIVIYKYETGTTTGLEGAVFEVEVDTTNLGEFVSDEDGKVVISYEEYGKFLRDNEDFEWTILVREVQAPAGYLLDDENWHRASLKPDQDKVEFVFENTKYPEITVLKIDKETLDPLEGAIFEISIDGVELPGPWVTDEDGLITISYDIIGGYLLEQNKEHWTITVTEIVPPDNYNLDKQASSGDYTQTAQLRVTMDPIQFVFTNVEYRDIHVTKKDDLNSNTLAGAEFTLECIVAENHQAGTIFGQRVLTTDETGTVLFKDVPNGTYKLWESNSPSGYDENGEVITVIVTSDSDPIIYVTFKNEAYSSLTIRKLDTDSKEPIPGAQFKVETADNSLIGTFETDTNGEILVSGIEPGAYVVTEMVAPEGYQIDSTPQTVVVEYGKNTYVEHLNEKKGGLLILLKDIVTEEYLQGGEFEIRRASDDTIVHIGTTDTSGSLLLGTLETGKYIITQNKAPDNYFIIEGEETQEKTVLAGEQQTVTFYNHTAGMVIEKIDSESNETLQGARFKVTRSVDNLVIGEYVTGNDGLALVSGLQPGYYIVEEIVAPDGYVIDSTPQTILVEIDKAAHVTFFNTPQKGITIHVVDKVTRDPIANAMVEVWEQNGNFVQATWTNSNGVVMTDVLPSGYYDIILDTSATNGYYCEEPEVTLEVVDGKELTYYFECVQNGSLRVQSLDGTGVAIPGMTFTVVSAGDLDVGGTGSVNYGTYTTISNGSYTLYNLAPGAYIVTPTVAPDGYTLNGESQYVTVRAGETAEVDVYHNKVSGLQIRTTDLADGAGVGGVQYEVHDLAGLLKGTVSSDHTGMSYLSLEPGYYTITPVSAPEPYFFVSPEVQTVEVKADVSTNIEMQVHKLSSLTLKFVDGQTNTAIYGVRVLLKSGTDVLKELVSDSNGEIKIEETMLTGNHTMELIGVPDGYRVDTMPRTLSSFAGATTIVEWYLYKDAGQIQMVVTSSDYNNTLFTDAGSTLQGAVFEIMNADNYQVMGHMISDNNGVAASSGLPIGRYIVKQVVASPYYGINTKEYEIRIKVNNDVVREYHTCPSIEISTEVDHQTNEQIDAGMTMRVDITAAGNTSSVRLDYFFMHIKIPTDGGRAITLASGKWNSPVTYSIYYKTNMTDYRLLAGNIQANNMLQYNLDANSLALQMGEYLTDIRYEFGTVPAGFHVVENPMLMVYTLTSLPDMYNLMTRIEAGGQFSTSILGTNGSTNANTSGTSIDGTTGSSSGSVSSSTGTTAYQVGTTGVWDTSTSLWTTIVRGGKGWDNGIPNELPKTGY